MLVKTLLPPRRLLLISLVLLASTKSPSAQNVPKPDADPRIEKLVSAISEERLRQIEEKLTNFVTRHTLSDTNSPARGIGAARQWIFDELRRSNARLQVSFDSYKLARQGRLTREVELRNVVAVLPGKTPRRVYVTGHYDTVNLGSAGQTAWNTQPAGATAAADPQLDPNQDYNVAAPGANDDGSGTALTMELARVFADSGIDFDATLVFACWAGEEQGLFGSLAHARKMAAEGVSVEAVFNNDIVGNSHGGNGVVDAESVRIYSLGPEDSPSRSLARYVKRVAAIYVPRIGSG
jgi:acetylornithine deacetylase/succinyl-diaminopimelate desuccinylase-like protein